MNDQDQLTIDGLAGTLEACDPTTDRERRMVHLLIGLLRAHVDPDEAADELDELMDDLDDFRRLLRQMDRPTTDGDDAA